MHTQHTYPRVLAFFFLSFSTVNAEIPPNAGVRVLLVANAETTLSAQTSGEIKYFPVSGGDRFRRGQTLVKFDCRLHEARLNRAKAELQAARKTYEANQKLQAFEAVSELEVAMAEADVLKAEADVVLGKVEVSLCVIHAPFSGRVVEKHTSRYASATPGTPLLDIVDDKPLEAQLHIPSAWLVRVEKGIRFKVRIDETGGEYQAEVIRLGAKVDAVSQTLEIAARIIDQDAVLLPGMSGTAYFE